MGLGNLLPGKRVAVGSRKKWESQISSNDSVLDVGCWGGRKLTELSLQTKKLHGMDITESNFGLASPEIRSRLKVGDVTKSIPFDDKFDWIIFGEVLEHVSDDEAALKNISRALKKGGKLILTTPRSVKGFQAWDPAWFRWKVLGGQRHYHYSGKELASKLRGHGLKIKEYYILGNSKWVFCRWFNVFLNYVLRINKKISPRKETDGFCDWFLLVEKE